MNSKSKYVVKINWGKDTDPLNSTVDLRQAKYNVVTVKLVVNECVFSY